LLIIVSDIHLSDGTCGKQISSSAFHLFADRIKELAFNASLRADGTYCPVEVIDILLMGDILDPLHSTSWLDTHPGEIGYTRPWTDFHAPEFVAKLGAITRAILNNNRESIEVLKGFTRAGVTLPPTRKGTKMGKGSGGFPVKVHLHYMVGNHDWYYHLPGSEFDAIRSEIIQAFGLSNPHQPFPHELKESALLSEMLGNYKVYAQHGDIYDLFNFNREKGRNSASLGDAFSVEVINRFPLEARKLFGNELPPNLIENLRELVNIRPILATPLWISSQLTQNHISKTMQKKLKGLWDELSNEFLNLQFIQAGNIPFKMDSVNELELVIHLTDRISFKTIDSLVVWLRKRINPGGATFAKHALKEEAFLDRKAQFIVYGHTHRHEVVPLDTFPGALQPTNQLYLNSGTWHTFVDLAVNKPKEQKFIPYQVMTYLSFYHDCERQGRLFESWAGTFSD
jgi:hypothetical protein